MLYDDSEQLEVRHVISLQHYDVDIYGGGEEIPEGELWIKRNCIRLTQRPHPDKTASDTKPYYLFSENCSEKEDFYHAMLQSQDHRTDTPRDIPLPLKFNTPDLVKLVQQLHASEENLHTRWINALIGRLFLALYKTEQINEFIWTKITKKIARVPKPALISKINLQKVDMGTLPPFITNPKLRELTVDGDMTVEADVSYKGNFRVEISAIARIDLGPRFKAREVTLVLATTLKKLEGHILVRMKPPPSNRLWVTFETAPKMELSLEPIVSSRQITYGVILRAIESRLREVVSETLVLPNWDDIPFKDSEENPFRGGIWMNDAKKERTSSTLSDIAEQAIAQEEKATDSDDSDPQVPTPASTDGARSTRTPTLSSIDSADAQATAYSSATDVRPAAKPRAMKSGSFTSAVSPVVGSSTTTASATKSELRERQHDATSIMKTISRSQPASPAETPVGSPSQPSLMRQAESRRSTSPAGFDVDRNSQEDLANTPSTIQSSATLPNLSSSADSQVSNTDISHSKSRHGSSLSLPRNTFASAETRQAFNQTMNTAATAAKKWFAARQQNSTAPSSPMSPNNFPRQPLDDIVHEDGKDPDSTTQTSLTATSDTNAPLGSPANPIGRGQLIPESGHHPSKAGEKKNTAGWSVPSAATIANLTRRKPVTSKPDTQPQPSPPAEATTPEETPPPLPMRTPTVPRPQYSNHERKTSVGTAAMGMGSRRKSSIHQPIPPPSTRQRGRRPTTEGTGAGVPDNDGILVVEAPQDASNPTSPVKLSHRGSKSSIGRDRKQSTNTDDGERMVFEGMEVDDGVS
jgi:hypothetical protein